MKKNNSTIILKGNIGDIGFEYEIKTKKDHKLALKDLKSFAGKLEKSVKDGSPTYQKINRYRQKTEELNKQTKQLEKQLKYTKRLHLIQSFESLIHDQIKHYKDWEIEDLITNKILSTNRYGGSLRRLIHKEIQEFHTSKERLK